MLRLSAHFLRRNSAKLAVKRPLALSSPSAITRSVSFLRPSTLTSLISTLDPTIDPFFKTQVRWKRKDGARFSREQRQPSRKERHKYHLKLKAKAEQEERHANPGYKSRPLKEFNETFKQAMLDDGPEMDLLDNPMYGVEDAVLDDLIGNSSDVSSTPTPEPKYFGHKHGHYSNKLKMLMNNYQEQVLLLQAAAADNNNDTNKKALIEAAAAELPDEKTISMALRAYRDEQSTRLKPVGLVKALTYLLQKHNVPLSAFGENTYTTLLTCCRTAKEGRKVLSIMRQEQVPISDYAWSILVDIYAKTGDYLGAAKALDDMLDAGVPPTLPAFTSFFAACYKVANDGGRVAHSIRAKAANLAFEKWQQMRVVGIDPDAMAYGAMLRLCAAQGRPEQAINMLEEMQQMGVKPTTLCFTSALRAVSKSHATMIRYENGASKRNRKREYFTGHHGNMARTIVILAENAEVKLDDGFTAALIMCAANAGDAATAKAVYIASQVRRLDQFRTIGTDEHLARLRGEVPEEEADDDQQIMISAGEDGALSISDWTTSDGRTVTTKDSFPSYERREYGKDSRVLSALLHACAVACGPTDIGTIWQGRENEGYLCPNSLRLINAKKIPEYHDMSIPHERLGDGMISKQLDVLDEDYRPGKRQARKFDGLDVHEDHPDNSLEVSDQFAKMYWDEDGNRKKDVHNLTHNELWHMKYGIEDENREFMLANGRIPKKALESREPDGLLEAGDDDWDDEVDDEDWSNEDEEDESVPVDMRFDQKTQRWSNVKFRGVDNPEATESLDESTSDDVETVQEEEMYFDTDAMKWATRLVTKPKKPKTAAVPPQRTEPQTVRSSRS
jgi:pentatricopeptide repeat protein